MMVNSSIELSFGFGSLLAQDRSENNWLIIGFSSFATRGYGMSDQRFQLAWRANNYVNSEPVIANFRSHLPPLTLDEAEEMLQREYGVVPSYRDKSGIIFTIPVPSSTPAWEYPIEFQYDGKNPPSVKEAPVLDKRVPGVTRKIKDLTSTWNENINIVRAVDDLKKQLGFEST